MKKLIRITLAWCKLHKHTLLAFAGGLAAGLVYNVVSAG